jgi:hypothetical protein
MAPREEFQQLLETICPNVYFQPPPNVQMIYPAIVYRRAPGSQTYADNAPYNFTQKYDVTLITRNPDDSIYQALRRIWLSRHERFFVADNLNHDAFSIYF